MATDRRDRHWRPLRIAAIAVVLAAAAIPLLAAAYLNGSPWVNDVSIALALLAAGLLSAGAGAAWVVYRLARLPADRAQAVGRRRLEAGLCPRCGYDLRASPDRCPECGSCITQISGGVFGWTADDHAARLAAMTRPRPDDGSGPADPNGGNDT